MTITAERGFVASRTSYQWWPTDGGSLFSANGSGFNASHLDFGGNSHNGEEVIALVAAVVAVYVVVEVTEFGYHHVHGVQLALRLDGQGMNSMYPITWGTSRLALPSPVLAQLAAGDVRAMIVADGTRHLRIPIPAVSWTPGETQHAVCLAAGGAVIVDDHRLGLAPALR